MESQWTLTEAFYTKLNSTTFKDLQPQFPGFARTKIIYENEKSQKIFKDFPGDVSTEQNIRNHKMANNKHTASKIKCRVNYLADHWIIVNTDFTAFCYPTVTSHLQQCTSNYAALITHHIIHNHIIILPAVCSEISCNVK